MKKETGNIKGKELKIEGRSCKHVNGATGYLDVQCDDCNWYNSGVRPSKF